MKVFLIIATLFAGSLALAQTTWYEITTPTSEKLTAIDFPSDQVGYIVGNSGTMLKTIDGGQSWAEVNYSGITFIGTQGGQPGHFTDVAFVNELTGYVVAGYSGIYKTTDGGDNWTQVPNQVGSFCYPHSLHLFSEDNFVTGGSDCFQGATINVVNAGTWTSASVNYMTGFTSERVVELSFFDNNLGLGAIYGKYILRTVDGGQNWDTIPAPIGQDGTVTSVVMVDDQVCFAGYDENGGSSFGVLKSTDGGQTWAQDPNSATFFYPAFLSICKANNGDVYSGGTSLNAPGLIFETPDNGATWMYESLDHPINDMTSYGSDVTFGIGDSGYVVVNQSLSTIGLEDASQDDYSIYPIPSSSELQITSSVEINAYEIVGLNGTLIQKHTGETPLSSVDISTLRSGTYLLKTYHNGKAMRTTRFVKSPN